LGMPSTKRGSSGAANYSVRQAEIPERNNHW
jgi:hypothetical protein